ncbi:hypothetical protein CANCADRAFT_27934 [Tortispora caseinolytica NRRL Y-17796]|uniref:Phosphatase PP2A regulatory subunit A/Splicing factor 3B subunit 1-like HEAT repeat domain-containing protein n=1 Tax=Tortispora caseinolytica NRRL Y-17796 TaxID=767744 RepID=A0A1E4TB91_9ASCO|nr:hypothetical protein CANCADRAFT_27934 [Tortispora caseinolytica NRRL Y-17796]
MDTNNVESDQLYPLAVLFDELKHDDVTFRLSAIRHLSTIALALGPERTRSELLPFLQDSIDDEDEVLAALAEELGDFIDYVGGPQFAHLLLGPLDALAGIEEPTVRDKATASINKIIPQLPSDELKEHVIPLVEELSTAEWFTSRISATHLFAVTYGLVSSSEKPHLLELYETLAHDETPMVRRAAALKFPTLIAQMDASDILSHVLPLFDDYREEDQDSVRLLAVDILVAVAKTTGPASAQEKLFDLLNSLFEDKSWRVRYMVADRFASLASAMGEGIIDTVFVPHFIQFMKDQEAEVRTAIAKQLSNFAVLTSKEVVIDQIIPAVRLLAEDNAQHVRAALASEIGGLSPILGKEDTIDKLLPIFLQMLKDDFPDVRLNIICRLQSVNEIIGIEFLSQSLLPAINELAEDKQWRIRLAIIEYIPLLALQLGTDFFNDKLQNLCLTWLWDPIYSIREAACINLKKLTQIFGVTWALQTIIPSVVKGGTDPNYLYRMTTLMAIANLVPVIDFATIKNYAIPFVHDLITDSVPNIRFNAAKAYKVILQLLLKKDLEELLKKPNILTINESEVSELVRNIIEPDLQILVNDDDVDVQYFAEQSLSVL